MDLGVVLQCTPPASGLIDLARRAETNGFDYVWTFDSHILWQEPYVIYSKILNETHRIIVGPMVTNPATRDVTVTASVFATLNEMYGNRTVIGIGRGDSAVRITNGKPVSVGELRDSVLLLKDLTNGRSVDYKGSNIRLPWANDGKTKVFVAAYGPKVLAVAGEVGDGYILQLADPQIAAWTIKSVKDAAAAAGRDPDEIQVCVAAPAYVTNDISHAREQLRWFGGMVGNHVGDIVTRYGQDGRVPQVLTDYIKGREGYEHGSSSDASKTRDNFVPDEIIDRFCIIGPVEEHIRRLNELRELGVDQFALYLQHDDNDATLSAYGRRVIPAMKETVLAKT